MRKKVFLLIGISFILFAECKQFLADIEKDLAYWASTVLITDKNIPSVGIDIDGYPCLASNEEKIITLKLINPKNHILKTPSEPGAPSDIVVFGYGVKGQSGGTPQHGQDYTLTTNGTTELKLSLNPDFLKKHEQGKVDLHPSITLYNKEG